MPELALKGRHKLLRPSILGQRVRKWLYATSSPLSLSELILRIYHGAGLPHGRPRRLDCLTELTDIPAA